MLWAGDRRIKPHGSRVRAGRGRLWGKGAVSLQKELRFGGATVLGASLRVGVTLVSKFV